MIGINDINLPGRTVPGCLCFFFFFFNFSFSFMSDRIEAKGRYLPHSSVLLVRVISIIRGESVIG